MISRRANAPCEGEKEYYCSKCGKKSDTSPMYSSLCEKCLEEFRKTQKVMP